MFARTNLDRGLVRGIITTVAIVAAFGLLTAAPAAAAPAVNSAAVNSAADNVSPAVVSGLHLQNASSLLCLVARAGSSSEPPAVQTTCDFNAGRVWDDQYWQVFSSGSGPGFQIYSSLLGKCLAARGTGEQPVEAVGCDFNHGTYWNDQHWTLTLNSDSTLQFENNSGHNCLAARGSAESAALVVACDYRHNAHWNDQHWFQD